jgi:Collagen triple helix repeat (20 copies)
MSSVTPITNQLNNIGNCNSNNCCEQIAALTSRVAALESKTAQAQSTANAAKGEASEAIKKGASALVLIGALEYTVGGLSGEIAAALAVANGAKAAAAAAAGQAATALGKAAAAAGQAATAIGTAGQAAASAAGALAKTGLLALQVAGIAYAIYLAQQAVNTAGQALSNSAAAVVRAVRAGENADFAITTAVKATDIAGSAVLDANRAEVAAVTALNAIKALASTVAALPGQIIDIRAIVNGVATIANGAATTADRALAAAAGAVGRPGQTGAPGKDGIPGQTGATGQTGAPGRDGANGRDGSAADPTIPSRVQRLESKVGDNTVNPGKEAEILGEIAKLSAAVLVMPTSIANSNTFRAAATSAAAAGACQSSRPGGCNGGSADQISSLGNWLSGISSGAGVLNNQVLQSMTRTLSEVNTKLGSQVTGGIGKWVTNIAEVANRSQILNIFTWIGVMHNAYFLSNSLTQTLFSAVSNSLAALGIKDTSTDPAGTPFNVGKLVSTWTDTYFKSIFGVAQVEGMKAEWKRYSRIYQAAAQVMYSIQSIGQSILGALEVVGSHVAKIGNAMQKFRLVGEKAYSWMNPQPGFQNRFFTVLQGTQEVVSQIDQVASTVLSTQESITQMGKNKDDLVKSMSEDPAGKKADAVPEASLVKAAEELAKSVSKSPDIPDSAQVKP